MVTFQLVTFLLALPNTVLNVTLLVLWLVAGSGIFKAEMNVLEKYIGPKLAPKLVRVHSVFKANVSNIHLNTYTINNF